ncbi:hypothetical protein FRB99_003496 [Tulasnella sp. 403]|nr:hypothetical protein FRB99_003496 [Tulasnella sp. 403]
MLPSVGLQALLSIALLPLSSTFAAPTSLSPRGDGSFSSWVDANVDTIKGKLGIKTVDTPVEVFNVPGYANFTGGFWNARVHGTAYRPLPLKDSEYSLILRLHNELNKQLFQWTDEVRKNVRNMTRTLLSISQSDLSLTFRWQYNGQEIQHFTPPKTDSQGHFDAWTMIYSSLQQPGRGKGPIQKLDGYTDGYLSGNTTTYLVPEEGITVVSDIDDILRETRVWYPRQAFINTVGMDYYPWMKMNEFMDGLAKSDPNIHFHYVTTTAQRGARRYVEFINSNFPPGSFDFTPFKREANILRLMETFPKRKFILLGDNSNSDVTAGYSDMANLFPDRVQCILLRNITATDPYMALPHSTGGFKTVSANQYQFFRTPADLAGIDFANGGCRNFTFAQNLTFGWTFASADNTVHDIFEGNSPWDLIKGFFNKHF